MKTASSLAVLLTLILTACRTPRGIGDDAFARGDWPRAAKHYAEALERSRNPAEIELLRERLEASLQEAAFAHLGRARLEFSARRYEAAMAEIETSLWYRPSASADILAEEVKEAWSKDLRQRGATKLSNGDPVGAERLLAEAERLRPSEAGTGLLAEARRKADDLHGRSFDSAVAAARQARQGREWTRAAFLYERAHAHRRTPETTREANFCRHMMSAEREVTIGRPAEARRFYEAALESGLDAGHVRERMRLNLPQRFLVQVHSASVLPYRPGTAEPWDGTGPVEAPALFAKGFAYFHTGERIARAAELAGLLAETVPGDRAPDCYPVLALPDRSFGGASLAVPDDLNPVWDRWYEIEGRLADQTPVYLTVMDRDEPRDEPVGAWRTTMGDLLGSDGRRLVLLFDREGNLRAGGVLVLRIGVKLVE